MEDEMAGFNRYRGMEAGKGGEEGGEEEEGGNRRRLTKAAINVISLALPPQVCFFFLM